MGREKVEKKKNLPLQKGEGERFESLIAKVYLSM